MCIPLDRYGLRIGTVNIESSIEGAFDSDVEFFKNIVNMFIDYYGQIIAVNDAEWLSRLSFKHINYHKLEEFSRKLKEEKRKELDAIISSYEGGQEMSGENAEMSHVMLADVILEMKEYALNLQRHGRKKDIISMKEDGLICISEPFAISLRLIITSLIENSNNHSDLRRDKFIIKIHKMDFDDVNKENYAELVINYKSNAIVERLVAEKFFISPFYKRESGDDGSGVRYGMFLIGVHTRLLGGCVLVVGVDGDEEEIPLNVIIRLPIKKY